MNLKRLLLHSQELIMNKIAAFLLVTLFLLGLTISVVGSL